MDKEEMIEIAISVWDIESRVLSNLPRTIDREALIKAVEMIVECKNKGGKVLTVGLGTSMAVAKKVSHTLSCIEIPSLFLSPGDAIHGGLGALQRHDLIIAISKGGNTQEILNLLPSIKKKGVKIIAVTENEDSILAKNSDLVLKYEIEREADEFNMLATASSILVIAMFDAISIIIMKYTNYTKEQFAIIHPGGAVGERLLKGEK